MPQQGLIVRVLISCPSDVDEERGVIEEVVRQWNIANSLSAAVVLEPVVWTSHAMPELGDRPQEIINKQLVRNCDILTAVFWTRLGTPTGKAESGTVEEIEEFMAAGKPVLLYFSDKPCAPSAVDARELERVRAFREKMRSAGLVSSFHSVEGLRGQLQRHLPLRLARLPLSAAARRILTPENPREAVVFGASSVTRAVAKAMGPAGSRISVRLAPESVAVPRRRGRDIAKGFHSEDPLEAIGMREMERAAESVLANAGDGSKSAILLSGALLGGGHDALRSHNRLQVLKGIEKGVAASAGALLAGAAPPEASPTVLEQIASTSAGDRQLGSLAVAAVKEAGPDGILSVEYGSEQESTLERIEGMQIDRGYLSSAFVNDPDRDRVILEDAYVLVHDRKVSAMRDLLPVLEMAAADGKPLLLIAEDVDGEALATLAVNAERGTLKCAAIKAPSLGARRHDLLEDIAILTGGRVVTEERGRRLETISRDELGVAGRVVIARDMTLLLDGRGEPATIQARVQRIRAAAERAGSIEGSLLTSRAANLVGRAIVVRVGGATEPDRLDNHNRVAAAVNAVKAAMESGWVVGGGAALVHTLPAIRAVQADNPAEFAGLHVVLEAVVQPSRALAGTARRDPEEVVRSIENSGPGVGFDVVSREVTDLVAAGVLDPAKVVIGALEKGYAAARGVLLTDEWALEAPRGA